MNDIKTTIISDIKVSGTDTRLMWVPTKLAFRAGSLTEPTSRSMLGLYRRSINDNIVELTVDGQIPNKENRLKLFNEKSYNFRVELTCVCKQGPAHGLWNIAGIIKNINGTTQLINLLVIPSIYNDPSMSENRIIVNADDVNDCLCISCSGIIGNEFSWFADVNWDEFDDQYCSQADEDNAGLQYL